MPAGEYGEVVVNVTVTGSHWLQHGYVMRYVSTDASGNNTITTYGEGNSFLQTLPGVNTLARWAWESNSRDIIGCVPKCGQ